MSISSLIKTAVSESIKYKRAENTRIVDGVAIESILSYCQSRETEETSIYDDVWFYLSQELATSRNILKRKKIIYIIDQLMHNLPKIRPIVSDNISLIVKSAGLMTSLPLAMVQKDLAKDHNETFVDYVKEIICLWDILYGRQYLPIHMMIRYLRESLQIALPDLMEKAQKMLQEKKEKEVASQRKVLLQTKRMIGSELGDTVRSVELSLYTLDECFSIIFPKIIMDMSTSNDVFASSSTAFTVMPSIPPISSTVSMPHSSTVINEQHVTIEEDEEDDDFDDVQWQSEDVPSLQPSSTNEQPYSDKLYGSVPYTLKISLSTKLHEIKTQDNEILIATVKEVSSHLVKHHVPKLKAWKTQLQLAIEILSVQSSQPSIDDEEEAETNGINDSERSRKRSRSEEPILLTKAEVQQASHSVHRLLVGIAEILRGKCKTLLKS